MDAAKRGADALAAGRADDAVREYTAALAQNPQAASYYVQRSAALARRKPTPDHAGALRDAEAAVVLAHRRARAELIASAQFRRAVSLYGLGRWADCAACLDWSEARNPGDKAIPIWRIKTEDKLAAAGQGGSEARSTIPEIPQVDVDDEKTRALQPDGDASVTTAASATTATSTSTTATTTTTTTTTTAPMTTTTTTTTAAGPTFTPGTKIRHDWYQSTDTVTVSLMAKGVPNDASTSVEILPTSLTVSFPLPASGSDYDFSLDPLFAEIVPAESRHRIMSTKIEFVLKKAVPGQKWHSLEGRPAAGSSSDDKSTSGVADEAARRAALGLGGGSSSVKSTASGPAYPTSSRTGPKDWDKVVTDLGREGRKGGGGKGGGGGGGGKGQGEDGERGGEDDDVDDDDDDDAGGDDVNNFFKKLYRNADPDTRRAMVKSFQESNGTALSTNWTDVGSKTFETTPPDGMEAKKWEI